MFLFLLLPMLTFYIFLETFVGFSNLWPDRGTVLGRRGDAAWSSGRLLWVVPGPLLRAAVSPREAQSPSGPSPSGSSSFSHQCPFFLLRPQRNGVQERVARAGWGAVVQQPVSVLDLVRTVFSYYLMCKLPVTGSV